MNIRYFFVADVIKRSEIVIEYCPTDEMIGDFFTKPLGGAKFRRFRNIIMNIDHDEFGPVDLDELTAIHNEKMKVRFEIENKKKQNEPTKNKMSKDVDSQECVGDQESNPESRWANMGAAHKNPNIKRIPLDNKRSNSGRALKLTYAQVVAE